MHHHSVAGARQKAFLPYGLVHVGGSDGLAPVLEQVLENGKLRVGQGDLPAVGFHAAPVEVHLQPLQRQSRVGLAAVLLVAAQK